MRLADPDESPNSDIVIWDGDCRFCRKQVERLAWFDATQSLSYMSLHDPRVAERFPQLSHEQLMAQLWVIRPRGQIFGGADAIRYLSLRLPLLWPIAPLLYIPFSLGLWRWLYRQVAARRYRLAGRDCNSESCHLHAFKQKSQPHS